MYRYLLRPLLFLLPTEAAHRSVTGLFSCIMKIPGIRWAIERMYVNRDPGTEREVFGLLFPNPVGLAAGFDKEASLHGEFSSLGFGFIEIGTVTPRPQPGNPKPRMFRLPTDEGLINRMGFNNDGVKAARERLAHRKAGCIIGGNIGKNKDTPNQEALNDYLTCFRELHDHVDYFVVNVSSPNTPGLRELQDREPLMKILSSLKAENDRQAIQRPILLKIAPDLTDGQLDDIIGIVSGTGIDGVVATNTTISRDGLKTPAAELKQLGAGGLSGKPLKDRSTEVIRYLHEKSNGSFPIIGVGGIHSAEDALEKLNAGASLIQLYTGFIYEGPGLVREINRRLSERE